MRMEAGLDTGPMLLSRPIPIDARDDAKSLHDKLAALGAQLIEEALQALCSGAAAEVAQPREGVTFAAKIDKAEAAIHWERHAEDISRQVRAFNPWPMAETLFTGKQVRIWEAEPIDSPDMSGAARPPGSVLTATREGIDVVCGTGVLRILKLQLAGRKALRAEEFLRGQRLDGARFGTP
jgi:methionyl-tRNA formyltransferase